MLSTEERKNIRVSSAFLQRTADIYLIVKQLTDPQVGNVIDVLTEGKTFCR